MRFQEPFRMYNSRFWYGTTPLTKIICPKTWDTPFYVRQNHSKNEDQWNGFPYFQTQMTWTDCFPTVFPTQNHFHRLKPMGFHHSLLSFGSRQVMKTHQRLPEVGLTQFLRGPNSWMVCNGKFPPKKWMTWGYFHGLETPYFLTVLDWF
jgi:hypothetical protein